MRLKPMEERVENFKLFYEQRNNRPLLGFFLGSEYPLFRYPASRALPDNRPLRPEDVEVAPYLDDNDRLFEAHEACGGDFIFSACAFWGIPWLEAGLGLPLHADHKTGSIYSEAPEHFTGPDSIPVFDPDNPWMRKACEFLDKAAERSAGRYPLATTRMRGISDLLSALYGGENFVFELMSDPDSFRPLCEKLTDYWIAWGRMQLEHIPLFHGGVGSFYYYNWAPPGTVWHQEDAAALLSPELYDQVIRPWDERIVQAFGGCIMHQHPTGFFPYKAYLEMGMTALELHIDEGGPSAEKLYPVHREILQRRPLLIWGNMSEADMDWLFSKLPGAGLAVSKVVSSPEEAHAIFAKYGTP